MEHIAADLLLKGLAPEGFADGQPIGLVTTDSREVCPGCIFVAFPGERFDGHDFAAKALEEGAAYVVLNHPVEGVPAEKAVISPDSYHAMMVMGANYRSQFHPKVVGVTGSVGKTTTREMVAAALSAKYKTFKTPANHNSQIGVPLTISEISENDEIGVLELGMSEPGEMAVIAEIAAVDSAVMTNIGVTHIENLGSRENILKEKLHIQDGMKAGGILFVNGDNDMLSTVHAKAGCHTVRYGLGADNDYRAEDLSYPDGFP